MGIDRLTGPVRIFSVVLMIRYRHTGDTSGGRSQTATLGMPCEAGNFQWVQFPPGDGSLQPEAVGAVVEVTKLLKYFDVTGHLG